MAKHEMPAIETYGLSKRYGQARGYAIKDVDITVMPGEVYGFLGPNGAGKTTTIRTLLNFIRPTFGNAQILGFDTVADSQEIKRRVGYLSGDPALYNKMTGRQFLRYMSGLQPPKSRHYADGLSRLFQAELDKKIGELSRGNKQKISIIQAFMHQPAVLILDEPTSGLDPLMQEAFYQLVRSVKERGATVFVSSHNLTEVQKMCDKAGFIRKGRLVAEQSIADLHRSAVQTYDVAFAGKVPAQQLRKQLKLKLKLNTPQHATITLRGELKHFLAVLSKYDPVSVDRREINLEEEFLKFYKGGAK